MDEAPFRGACDERLRGAGVFFAGGRLELDLPAGLRAVVVDFRFLLIALKRIAAGRVYCADGDTYPPM
ncbi:hypothetical protein [Nesterenkonia rhizosphaerae]|uniref:Uncharacterized protein n=1 Tax=Nesterenkonia rhizosphaerae TaxID=1348272 RepID=A0ABP9FQY8_9MICC